MIFFTINNSHFDYFIAHFPEFLYHSLFMCYINTYIGIGKYLMQFQTFYKVS